MNVWEIAGIDIVVFYITYILWLRAEDFDKDGDVSKLEAIFVALVATALLTAYLFN